MGKLNINRNIFLEKEELQRFQRFVIDENIATQVLLDNTTKWGVVRTVFGAASPDFLVEAGTNLGTIKIAELSKAVTASKQLILQQPIDNISVTSDSNWYWVKISPLTLPYEEGECSISVDGTVTGINTKFLEVLRGQQTEVPVKIKFYKETSYSNTQVYEVVDVIDDQNIILTNSSSFVAESGLKYFVIGSTPIGETLTVSQLEGLYQYDSCLLEFILEEITDTPPVTNYVEDEQFYIARVRNVAGTVTVQDKRGDQFLTFNVEGVDTKLEQSANLSDLTSVSEARNNLDVYSKPEINNLLSITDTGYINVINILTDVNNVDTKIRVRHKNGVVNCQIKIKEVGNIELGDVLFTLPSTIPAPPTDVFISLTTNGDRSGMLLHILQNTKNVVVFGENSADNRYSYGNFTYLT